MNNYFKYSSLAFQMLATISLFGIIGWYLDKYFQNETPACMAIFMLLGVIGSIYKVIKEIL